MTTPKGTKQSSVKLNGRDAVHVYSDQNRIVLQLRRLVPTEEDLRATSFKVGMVLNVSQAATVAGELLAAAAEQLKKKGEQAVAPPPQQKKAAQPDPKPKEAQRAKSEAAKGKPA